MTSIVETIEIQTVLDNHTIRLNMPTAAPIDVAVEALDRFREILDVIEGKPK